MVNDLVMEIILLLRGAPRTHIPHDIGCGSWSLDVSGGDDVVIAGAMTSLKK